MAFWDLGRALVEQLDRSLSAALHQRELRSGVPSLLVRAVHAPTLLRVLVELHPIQNVLLGVL